MRAGALALLLVGCGPDEVVCGAGSPGAHTTSITLAGPNIARQAATFYCEHTLAGEIRVAGGTISLRGTEADAKWFDAMMGMFGKEPETSSPAPYTCEGKTTVRERAADMRQFVLGNRPVAPSSLETQVETERDEAEARREASEFCRMYASRWGEAHAIGRRVFVRDADLEMYRYAKYGPPPDIY